MSRTVYVTVCCWKPGREMFRLPPLALQSLGLKSFLRYRSLCCLASLGLLGETFWGSFGALSDCHWALLGRLGALLGRLGACWRPLAVLGLSWRPLGALLGAFWGSLGALLGRPRTLSGRLGALCGRLGDLFGRFRAVLGASMAVLG